MFDYMRMCPFTIFSRILFHAAYNGKPPGVVPASSEHKISHLPLTPREEDAQHKRDVFDQNGSRNVFLHTYNDDMICGLSSSGHSRV